ncbi:MAG: substrate-binding domain-containing protein [Phycisphaerales bacterium JB063]
MTPNEKYIELLVETSTSWGSGLIQGIAQYARKVGGWRLGVAPAGRSEELRLHPRWVGHGIIARVNSKQLADEIIASGVPAVNVSCFDHGLPNIPQCTVNERIVGEMAAAHLLDCGLRHFAYYGPSDRPGYRDKPGDVFVRTVRAQGYTCHTTHRNPAEVEQRTRRGRYDDALLDWLRDLPKPVGLFTWSDVEGLRMTGACRAAGLRVPEEVAVLCGERDDLMSMVSRPTLSSIDTAPMRIGYEAAAMLDEMMRGKRPGETVRHVPPHAVISMGSTDTLAVPDEVVAQALGYIRANLKRSFGVDKLCSAVGVSRRSLEVRFQAELQRSPAAEIRRCRVELAKQLILSTDWSLTQIGTACGYDYPETFSRAFKREAGQTPNQFRSIARVR